MLMLFMIAANANGQNLVPNPSFENYTTCPTSDGQLVNATSWLNPNLHTPDYYNSCATAIVDVPSNWIGFQSPRTGNAYVGIGVAGYSGTREYIQVQLDSVLKAGVDYCVQFYVSLADSVHLATDDIGVYFSNTAISSPTAQELPFSAHINNADGNFLSNKTGWELVTGSYTAIGGENYITIGNFKDSANTDTMSVSGGGDVSNSNYSDGAYLYIDDVLVDLCINIGIEQNSNSSGLQIYPNPASNHLRILGNELVESVVFYNLMGQVIKTENKTSDIDIRELPDGTYIIKIVSNKNIYTEKLLIH